MSSPTAGVKDILVAAGVGLFGTTSTPIPWQIGIGQTLDAPDRFITVRKTGGSPANPRWLIDYPSVQVMVRGNENAYLEAETKAQQIKDVLLALPSQDLNGDRWVQVNMIGDIVDIGYDPEDKRPSFSLNFALIIEPASNATTHRQPL